MIFQDRNKKVNKPKNTEKSEKSLKFHKKENCKVQSNN